MEISRKNNLPDNIKRNHILQAIKKIDEEGIPANAHSTTYDLLYNDKRYPAKLVIALANEFVNGVVLDRTSFSGGLKSKCFSILEMEGFDIVEKDLVETNLKDSIAEPHSEYKSLGDYKPLNQILYGPPGTGKTYSTINKALEILDPEFLKNNNNDRASLKNRFDNLINSNRIGFVTFHQSFSYEDFVEGIKASTTDGNSVSYDVEDGIFKKMCAAAAAKATSNLESKRTNTAPINLSGRKIWKMSLGNTLGDDSYIYNDCIKGGYVTLGYGNQVDFSRAKKRSEVAALLKENGYKSKDEKYDYNITSVNNFKNNISTGDIIVISDGNNKFRAIAEVAGDYYFDAEAAEEGIDYCQCRKVNWLKTYSESLPKEELFNNNLSQMTLYRLKEPTIDLAKLNNLVNQENTANQLDVGTEVSSYRVVSLSNDLIEFAKPNGSNLPIARSIVNELVDLVKRNKINLEDIKRKAVFDKVETNLEKYLVNGYPNLLAPLVKQVIENGIASGSNTPTQNRVLIIDEINRGNIASIFGELITLIEPSKRASGEESLSVKLPYSKQSFSVPSNLYLIGTMNTADKSLAQVDIALRRRFEFIEMMPNYEVLSQIPNIEGIDIQKLVETLNDRIELLIDREHTIGHSFFLPLKRNPSFEKLISIFELQIFPLLEEYFFEDWEKVGQALGDHLKSEPKSRFIIEKFNSSKIHKLMGNDWEPSGIQSYVRNVEALSNPQAYIGIYEESN